MNTNQVIKDLMQDEFFKDFSKEEILEVLEELNESEGEDDGK